MMAGGCALRMAGQLRRWLRTPYDGGANGSALGIADFVVVMTDTYEDAQSATWSR